MTPRINEASEDFPSMGEFSRLLLEQVHKTHTEFNLRSDAPLFDIHHPLVLKSMLQYQHNPEQEPPFLSLSDWNFLCFANIQEALSGMATNYQVVEGKPFEIGRLLDNQVKAAVIDFHELGAVILSKDKLEVSVTRGPHLFTLPLWLNYALSPELWSSFGKWRKFHERLHDLFDKYRLLKGHDCPGYYPLHSKAKKLEEFGFLGSFEGETFSLTLPWSFPLSALERLEQIVRQEF